MGWGFSVKEREYSDNKMYCSGVNDHSHHLKNNIITKTSSLEIMDLVVFVSTMTIYFRCFRRAYYAHLVGSVSRNRPVFNYGSPVSIVL